MAGRFSITRRLVWASLIILPLYLTVTGLILADSHKRSLLAAAQEQLQLRFYNLLGAVEWEAASLQVRPRLQEQRYQQFGSGLYAAVTDAEGTVLWQSRSLAGLAIDADTLQLPAQHPPGEPVFDQIDTPEKLFRLRYAVNWVDAAGERRLVFTILESRSAYAAARQQFQRQLLVWLSGVGIALLLAQLLILRWGLSPLRRLAADLRRLESGEGEALGGDYPVELRGVTTGLNQLLAREHQLRERYRNTLGDLAHSLKTPLALLRNHLEDQPQAMTDAVDRMDRIISYQLQRPLSAGPTQLGKRSPLLPIVQRLVGALEKVYARDNIQFELDISGQHSFPGAEEDATELLGNLLDNACKACRGRVRVRSTAAGERLRIDVADDGRGIDPAQREQLLQRGRRGDQYSGGHGIGLAIVADIVAAHRGRLAIGDSDLGGAAMIVELPGTVDNGQSRELD